LHKLSRGPQKLRIEHRSFIGHQWSLFYNLDRSDSPFNTSWNEDHTVTNIDLNTSLLIAEGIVAYIATLGFYESGANNEYKVDPKTLIAILTGHAYS
jgi:hypothetical protein